MHEKVTGPGAAGRRCLSPPQDVEEGRGPVTVIPQRERITFLVCLAEVFAPVAGLLTAFTVVGGFAVLNVIPASAPGRAVTIGCRYYRDGAWWLFDVRTGELIGPANDVSAAAHQIRTQIERAATA